MTADGQFFPIIIYYQKILKMASFSKTLASLAFLLYPYHNKLKTASDPVSFYTTIQYIAFTYIIYRRNSFFLNEKLPIIIVFQLRNPPQMIELLKSNDQVEQLRIMNEFDERHRV